MMNKILKKTLALLPVFLLASCNFKYTYNISGLVISGGGEEDIDDIEDAGTYDVKIWVDDRIVELTKSQIGQFVASSGGKYTINATIEPVGEASAANSMLQDVQDGADLFCFAQDQLSRLKVAGALARLSSGYVDAMKEEMVDGALDAAKVNNDVYAFPITSDNGYFLYYDKNVVSDEEAGDMTKLLAACQRSGRTLNFEARSNGFYAASYFMATGCYSNWELDDESGKFKSYDDNYDSEYGVIAAKGLKELDNKTLVAGNSQASKLGSSAAAVISGIWEYEVKAVKDLEEAGMLGCAALPSFTVDGTSYHLSSFDGFKLLGVKPQVDPKKASVCRKIARFLTNEDSQYERFNKAKWGPTNKEAAQKEDVLSHKGLSALNEQHKYAKPQGQCPGSWFTALATTAKAVTATSSDAEIKSILANYRAGLPELLDSD